ncbi:MAG: hypothetical protein ACM3SU_13430 [Acidobacteriota bacterium]
MRRSVFFPAGLLFGALAAAAAAGADFKEVRRTVPLDPDGRVSIETFKGSIDVTAWDRPEVEALARIEPDEQGRYQAEKVRQTEVRIEGSGRNVRIESDYRRVRRHGFLGVFGDPTLPFVRYTIKLPRAARLAVKDYKSESRISGLGGGLDFDTYKGRVTLADLEGPVRLQTYKGDVRAGFARFAASRFETYKGEIAIVLPRGTAFDLDSDVGRRGSLSTDFEMAVRASDGGRRRGPVNGGGPSLDLETHRGTFRIRAK